MLRRREVHERFGTLPLDKCKWSVDSAGHVGNGDRISRAAEAVTAGVSSLCVDEPDMAQNQKNVLKVPRWNAL